LLELDENQLREFVNAQATWRAYVQAEQEARLVRGSMVWKQVGKGSYLIRKSAAGAQKSLGPRDANTEAMHANFQQRKESAQMRLKAMRARLDEQRKLNRVYRVGRVPTVVVRVLAALEAAQLAEHFLVIGTQAMYAYESAAGVQIDAGALATRDLDLLFDARKRIAFATGLQRGAKSLIGVLRKADPSFRVLRDQLQTAVNDGGFEVDIIRRAAKDADPHPMPMSDDEGDGDKIASGRRFEQLVIAANGEMATMRTVHPQVFVRLKQQLAGMADRDPLKAPKDRLQAEVAQQLWDEYLHRLERRDTPSSLAPARQDERSGLS
jgi:hypothetical protein